MPTARARKPPKPREREVGASADSLLTGLGFYIERRNVARIKLKDENGKTRMIRCGKKGQADRWGLLPDGRHLELELKRPGEVPDAKQTHWLRTMNGWFGTVAIWADNTATLQRVALHLMRGGSVEYGEGYNYDLV